MIDKLGGRKAVGLVLCLAVGLGVVCIKGDITMNLVTLILGLFTGFVAGNSVENVATGMTERAELQLEGHTAALEKQATPINLTDVSGVEAKLDMVIQTLQTNSQGVAFLVDRVMGKTNGAK